MKIIALAVTWLMMLPSTSRSQDIAPAKAVSRFDILVGVYKNNIDTVEKFSIKKDHNRLMLAVSNQGQVELDQVSGNTFKPRVVRPAALIEFVVDSSGNVNSFLWRQDLKLEWTKTTSVETAAGAASNSELDEYAGKYKINTFKTLEMKVENGQLVLYNPTGGKIFLKAQSANRFIIDNKDFTQTFEFIKDRKGKVKKFRVTRSGAIRFYKSTQAATDEFYITNFSDRSNGFNRADSLRGMLTPLRTCYDVTFYGLDVVIEPETKSIRGKTVIRFKTVTAFDKMQVDLYGNMKIEKILFHNEPLAYTREFNAVFVQLPASLQTGTEEKITILYSGHPVLPDMSAMSGGFFWGEDHNGKLWVESVCQGAGASLWWPCKDHQSDKPDSMGISITVPKGLEEISNGKLTARTELPGNLTRFDWFVNYPINTYNVVANIGDYTHFSETYTGIGGTIPLHFYCLSYNTDNARLIFNHVKPMLSLFEKVFGQYPFSGDGFTLMESIYPMEHQGAITFGPINNPITTNRFDSTDLVQTGWHETAHEWWGNNITCKDMADLWIHEAFATYAQVLCYEFIYGAATAKNYLANQRPGNKQAIIGTYDVNDFHLGDMYSKGALMLHTLRNSLDDDSLWFRALRDLQHELRYQSVTTEDVVQQLNRSTGKNLTPFFDQYLRYPKIPQLTLVFKQERSALEVQYKWDTDITGYNMPVRVTSSKNNFELIHPTNNWQTMNLPGMKTKDFEVDTVGFYINVAKQEQ